MEDPLCHKSKSNSRILGLRSDLYAKAVTRVSLAKAVAEVDTGANATNTFPPAAVCAHNCRQETWQQGVGGRAWFSLRLLGEWGLLT